MRYVGYGYVSSPICVALQSRASRRACGFPQQLSHGYSVSYSANATCAAVVVERSQSSCNMCGMVTTFSRV